MPVDSSNNYLLGQVAAVDKSEFFLPGSGASVLLIHGLTGTPYEMRWLGEKLWSQGVRVRGVRLAGHAQAPEDLGKSTHDEWYESVVRGFEELREHGDPTIVVGLSAGAVLGARLAADQREAVAGLVMLAPAFFLPRAIEIALKTIQKIGSVASRLYLLNEGGSDIHDAGMKRIHPSMRLVPVSAPINLIDMSKLVRRRLSRITQPALLIHSRQDHTCPMKRNARFVMKNLGSIERRVVVLDESFHVITVDSERERVASEVGNFVSQFRACPEHRAAG